MGARPLHHAAHVKVLHHVRLVEPAPNHARRTAKIRMPLPATALLWRTHCQAEIELITPIPERVIQIHVSIWVETALRRTLVCCKTNTFIPPAALNHAAQRLDSVHCTIEGWLPRPSISARRSCAHK